MSWMRSQTALKFCRSGALHMEDILQEAETYRKDFYAHLSKWELPPDNRYDLCFACFTRQRKPLPRTDAYFFVNIVRPWVFAGSLTPTSGRTG